MTLSRIFVVMSLVVALMTGGAVIAQEGNGIIQVVQWASAAEATSQYTDDSWSAAQAAGAPDVLECADNVNAWASADYSGQEALAVGYDKAVIPTQINIYQTYNPGAITGIDLILAGSEELQSIPDSADPGTACPGVFSLDLPEGLPKTVGLVIYLDQTLIGDWNEIDAVELVGIAPGEPSDSEPSSIEAGLYPQYAVGGGSGSGPSGGKNSGPSGTAQDYGDVWGTEFTCDDGTVIENGIDMTIIQQRSGSQYRVTVVGLGDFDPVLAVADVAGNHLCNDDDASAATYSANLPTTGRVDAASVSSQVIFNNVSREAFADIRLMAGGFGGMGGEFLVIVEGMISSDADGVGDPFSLYVSPAMLESGVSPTAYMIAVTSSFDPYLKLIDSNYDIVTDTDGMPVVCDDAGNVSLCWGESADLSGYYVSRSNNRQLPGGSLDAMLTIPIDDWDWYINYTMSNNNSYGDYVAVFHFGTAQKP